MDTSTHVMMGIGLAGLAHLDPSIAASKEASQVILAATILGSNAPDFDYFIKILKGNGAYIEHHRGLSHSVPMLFVWCLLFSWPIYFINQEIPFMNLFLWTLLAIVIHVVMDLFNAYGTQAGRPLTKRWLSLNTIPLFDPFIFGLHLIGIGYWLFSENPGIGFLFIYLGIIFYLLIRFYYSTRIINQVKKYLHENGKLTVIPTLSFNKWNFVWESKSLFKVGHVNSKKITLVHEFEKRSAGEPIIAKSLIDQNVKHFFNNSAHQHVFVLPTLNGYEVRWIDLRFRTKNHYPYMAIVKMNESYEIQSSYTGWIHQSTLIDQKLQQVKSVSPPEKNSTHLSES
ncbi:metal-dependent hydrolase [Metabacillus arenae]|uniref:Metal-dependent hydrolase n=1 Tax=Metabacillus arenae TaxID=2771434 RepID=A0A926RX90_9BACI|nr:metal-dependent hydrolase [Metabacillus arenae]MBD1381618.1 metal-dependent hydrolase [Metabacillus arenae]